MSVTTQYTFAKPTYVNRTMPMYRLQIAITNFKIFIQVTQFKKLNNYHCIVIGKL
jgi:hypothetical protein